MVDGSCRCPPTVALDTTGTSEAKKMGFASIIAISDGIAALPRKWHMRGKGKKVAKVTVESTE